MSVRLIVTALVALLAACAEPVAPDTAAVRSAIAARLVDIETMTNQGLTPDEMSALYLEHFSAAPAVLPYGAELLEGRAAISDFYTAVFGSGTVVSNTYTEPIIEVFGGYVVRAYSGTTVLLLPGVEAPATFANVYTDILVEEDGEWKIQWHSWVPAPAN